MRILIYLLVISIPFFKYELFTLDKLIAGAGSVPIHTSHVVSVALVLVFCLHILLNGGRLKIDKIGKAMLFLTGIYFVSVIAVFRVYRDFTEYFKSLAYMLLFTMLYFAFINLVRRQKILIKMIRIWIITSLAICIYGLYQFVASTLSFLPVLPRTELKVYQGLPRIYSLMGEPVELVLYLIYPMILMFIFVTGKQQFPFKTPARNLSALLLMIVVLILSFSLTGYACFCFFLLFYCMDRFIHADIRKLYMPIMIALIVVSGLLLSGIGNKIQNRLTSVFKLSEASSLMRLNSISIAYQEFAAHPIMGIGPGNYKSHSLSGAFPRGEKPEHADSGFFNCLAELGIIGVLAIFLLFAVLVKSLRKVIKLNKTNRLNLQISRGFYFVILVYIATFIPAGSWFRFGAWLNISIIGTWILLERKKTSEAKSYNNEGNNKWAMM